jgi:hypothetical protein
MIRAAKLDVRLYEEIEADTLATSQSMLVVVLSSLAEGIGGIVLWGIKGLIFGTISAVIGWFVWAYIVFYIGTKVFPEPETKADHEELMRTLGFSSTPGIIRILNIIPGMRYIVSPVAAIWMLAAMVIAARQALDYKSTLRAVGVCILGIIPYAVIMFLFAWIAGGMMKAL